MKVTVCIGSACHIKGSRKIVEQLQELVEEHGLGDKVELDGSLCMKSCRMGVCVTVDGKLHSVSPERTAEFFEQSILPECGL
ncbi:MAG: (2Fe-2S) ferredoxin domain-containing protein [Clostridia bacterium]|nr:(2Fe-2S) ferredoxin domain-containing protein [Clostridia bacterium]